MPIKTYKPKTPTLRYKSSLSFDYIDSDTPKRQRQLIVAKKRCSGRNNNGRITVRHRGGGKKRYHRIIDFKRNKYDVPGHVERIEYDPNRTCHIALVKYLDGERRYILATQSLRSGSQVISTRNTCEIAEGNCMPLRNIPLGTMVHNIELKVGKGGQVVRSAGVYAEILAKENAMVQVKFPSSEIRNVHEECLATIGQVSNPEHMNVVIGSAGRKRSMGRRPRVRGVAMNPVDHPMGGGEGRSSGGGHPVSPWGKKAKGEKTRRARKASGKYIVKRRSSK
jgi:large subunit ribosomal protein L2